MIPTRNAPGVAVLSLLAGLAACSGQVGEAPGQTPGGPGPSTGPGGGGGPPPSPLPGPDGVIDSAGPNALRRLTVLEYSNTIRDLLGVTLTDAERRAFAADQVVGGGYQIGAALVNSVDSRQFLDVATRIADAATADLGKLMPPGCGAPAGAAEQDCIGKFVDQFGLRAFRRPLAADEVGRFKALYDRLRGGDVGATFTEAVRVVVVAMLPAPEFVLTWEQQGDPIKDGNLIKFGPYEIASRLSYFLWASMPDDQLFAAAKSGALANPEQIATQARRLLADDRAKDALHDFHMQWLGLYGVDEIEKGDVYSDYSPDTIGKAMIQETAAFVDATMFGAQATGKLEDLFTASSSYLNEALAKHYGVKGVTGANFRKVDLDPKQRAGILTQGAFLTKHSKEVESFPIARGVYVLRQVLCQEIPEPNIQLPPPPEQMQGVTTRKLYEDFTKAGACQACHGRINAVGFAFENYDAVGGYREDEEGQKVDASGSIELPSGRIDFKNAIDLAQSIAKSTELRDCAARNWMRALLRREERPAEAGSLKAVGQAMAASSNDLRALIVALTKTRAFTHHAAGN
jgi:hypothetical protein